MLVLFGGLGLVNAALLLAGPRPSAPAGRPRARVGLVFDVGGRGDKSFNDLAFAGLDRARRDFGVELQIIEPGDGSDRESGMRLLAAQGFDLVVGAGFIFSDDMFAIAGEYPRTRFACVDYARFDARGFVVPPPNMVALKFREEEGCFLVGALAALRSGTGVIGFVGGMDIPLIHKFEAGYTAGARAVRPDVRVLSAYAGVTGEAFKNPAKGKELALAQFRTGADVIFHAAGSTGLGVFEAARITGRLAIGVDADQADLAPGLVLTSMLKRVDVAVYETVRAVVQGRFSGGVRSFGLAEGGLGWVDDARNRALIPAGTRQRVENLRRRVIAGEIRVPTERAP
jgi:basic membrane protein A and related proteins